MSNYIELIAQLKQKNGANFPLVDTLDLLGGYVQVSTFNDLQQFPSSKIREGMLAYVINSTVQHLYMYKNGGWAAWAGNDQTGVSVVTSDTDLTPLQSTGQLVFISDIKTLNYYDGSSWQTVPKIYIQSTEPIDKTGIWIDTSDQSQYTESSDVIQDLLKVISILQQKVAKLEFAFQNEIDSGDFTNNQLNYYNNSTATEPNYGTSESVDNTQQELNLNAVLADSAEPTEYDSYLPNAKHICIKAGTYAQMVANKGDLLPKELLWCYDTQTLYIKDPKTTKLVKIGSTTNTNDDTTMDGILTEIINSNTKITGIEFIDINNKDNTYLIQVKDGVLDVHDYRLDKNTLRDNTQVVTSTAGYYTDLYYPIDPSYTGGISPGIYVNMVYCGSDNGATDYSPVSHNFIEISNLTTQDLNLKGLYLHYTEMSSGYWVTLPLKGVVKSMSTFLIRGAQCSVQNINTTLIKVGTPDLYWTKSDTINSTLLDTSTHSIWDSNNLLKMSYNCALFISGEDSANTWTVTPLSNSTPWTASGVIKWYVDLVGFGSYNSKTLPCEGGSFSTNLNTLPVRYYTMDPVSQATKAMNKRANTSDWTYVNLASVPTQIDIQKYTPRNSSYGKTIFFNKNLLVDGPPKIVTCTLGYNAHKTRCFNWVSVGYYDEFIWIRKEGEEYSVSGFESFKSTDARSGNGKNWDNTIYNRIRGITTDGTPFTVHKLIKDFDEPTAGTTQKYYYKVGRVGFQSEERSFTIRNRSDLITNGFSYLQVTDQQGFNEEEYETWKSCSDFISNKRSTQGYDWCLNTGDETQNGNRINEWVDYYDCGNSIYKDVEQVFTVGNNDLCPLNVYTLGDGSDTSKTNPANVNYFFTFEHPFVIPKSASGVYIPSVYSFVYGNTYFLSMNSEITSDAITNIFGNDTTIYSTTLKNWLTNDLTQTAAAYTDIKWKTAFCHEAPFTIITLDSIQKFTKGTTTDRGGSHLNTLGSYWFSQYLQDNGFKLCMCGHKHTFSNSRLLREDPNNTMKPIIYDSTYVPATETTSVVYPTWYTTLNAREQNLCQLSNDSSLNFVKYVMCQATGYKVISNKELPAKNIPWLSHYYPNIQTETVVNESVGTTVAVNVSQEYPHYILWNIGNGTEVEDPTSSTSARDRILGKVYKLIKTSNPSLIWHYKYNSKILSTDLSQVGGNGESNNNYNIIVE